MKITYRVNSPKKRRNAAKSDKAATVAKASRPGMLARVVAVARHVPFSADLVAMYYVMLDADTPLPVKGTIATALLYAVSPDFIPGPVDDVLGLGAAATLAYAYRKPKHVAAARKALAAKKNPRNLSRPGEHEGRMVRSALYAIEHDAKELRAELRDDDSLPGWVTYKVYTAQDRLQPARQYLRERIADAKENPRRRKGTQVQSLIFDRDSFTVRTAHKWAMTHGFEATAPDVTDNTIRLRQIDPSRIRVVATIPLRAGVQAVIGFPKR